VSDSAIYNVNGVFPTTLEDRLRDKVRLSADWTPIEDVSVQLLLEGGKDSYSAPTQQGLRDSKMGSAGVDASWKVSDKWKLNGYWSRGNQTLLINNAGYLADLQNDNESVSLGIIGNLSSSYEVGATVSYLNDRNRYYTSLSSGAALVGNGLPDGNYRVTSLKLYGKYVMAKNADVRLDLAHQSATIGDWAWASNGTSFAYSDNSSIALQPNQDVTYFGISYIYKMK
jgi:hypothetical protein